MDRDRQVRLNKRILPFLKTVQQLGQAGWYRPQKDYEKPQAPPPPYAEGPLLEKPQAPTTTTVLPLEKPQTPLPPYAEGLPLREAPGTTWHYHRTQKDYPSRSHRHHCHRTQKDCLSRTPGTNHYNRSTSREAPDTTTTLRRTTSRETPDTNHYLRTTS